MQNIEYIILCVHFGKADPKKTKARIRDIKNLAWEKEKLILPIDRDFSLEQKFYGDYESYKQNIEKMFAFFASRNIPNVFMVLTGEEYNEREHKDNFGFEFPLSGVMVSDNYVDGSEAVPAKVIINDLEKTIISYKEFSNLLFCSGVREAYVMGEHLWWDRALEMKEHRNALMEGNSDFVSSVNMKKGKKTTYNKYDVVSLGLEIERKKIENLISGMRGCLLYNAEMFEYFGAMVNYTQDGFKIMGLLGSAEREAIKNRHRSVKGIPGCIYPTAVLTQSNPAEYFPQNYTAFMKGLSTQPDKVTEGKAIALVHPIINEIYRSMEGKTIENVQQEMLKGKKD